MMRDAELRREFHRLCRKRAGSLSDTEACFRAFKAGTEYMSGVLNQSDIFEQVMTAHEVQAELED
jgi:hypothetical protein